ncbi:MAG: short-chain dehydrogenase [Phycisphaeraceae bacterium]|nr:short-chain dehydrogenase [Phycisphaeraceae bacterium]
MGMLDSKTAIVTGGAAGIGEACVRYFVGEGANVLIGDVNDERGAALAAELGDRTIFAHLDVSDESMFVAAIDRAVSQWGGLDILVNNAGCVWPAAPIQETTNEQFDLLIDVNIRGTFFGCKHAYAHLKKSKGSVVNIASMAGVSGQKNHAAYGGTKGAINAMTRCAAVDWGGDGIRVNAICPAGVMTDACRAFCEQAPDPEAAYKGLEYMHALGRAAEPEEIASVAAFLCSEQARFVTGCIMPVTGGSECGYKC